MKEGLSLNDNEGIPGKLCALKFDSLSENDQFQWLHKLLKPTQEEIANLNSPYVWKKHIFFLVKNPFRKGNLRFRWFYRWSLWNISGGFNTLDFTGGPVIKTALLLQRAWA